MRLGQRGVTASSGEVQVPGLIGGAIVRAARRAAGLSRPGLAGSLGITVGELRDWEYGEVPLFTVPYVQLYQLAAMLSRTDAQRQTVLDELLIAGQCDLLVGEMLAGTADYAELPPIGADTVRGRIARELLAWGFQGVVPDRFRLCCRSGCLYRRVDRERVVRMVEEQRSGVLAGYADALLVLISPGRASRRAGWWIRRVAR
jgi:transcriptional regulator with XRE-family HTH domain